MASFTPEQIARVAERLYGKYADDHFEAGNLAYLRNVNTLGAIQMNWVVAWEIDDNRGMWCLDIEREKEERYWVLASIYGEDWALEEMNERRVRAVRKELREEKLHRA